MTIHSTSLSGVTVCTILSRQMNASNSPAIRDSLLQVVAGGERHMVIDMRHVERIDSSGIVALLAAKRAVASDGDMIFTSMTTPVAEIFHLTKMDHIFRVAEDASTAVSEVTKGGVSFR